MIHFHTAGMSDRDPVIRDSRAMTREIDDDSLSPFLFFSRAIPVRLSSASFLAFPSGAPDRDRYNSDQVQSLDA